MILYKFYFITFQDIMKLFENKLNSQKFSQIKKNDSFHHFIINVY